MVSAVHVFRAWLEPCCAPAQVVFAQLLIKGKNEGVHGFLVPIRDQVCPLTRLLCLRPPVSTGVQAHRSTMRFGICIIRSFSRGRRILQRLVGPMRSSRVG